MKQYAKFHWFIQAIELIGDRINWGHHGFLTRTEIMKRKIYIETSVISYLTARTSKMQHLWDTTFFNGF